MRMPHLFIAALVANSLFTAPALALDPCATSTAVLRGGFTQPYAGMGDYVYDQEMRLEHKGGGMTGLWVGTYYAQHSKYPFALDANARAAAMSGTSAIAGVDAICVPDLPDANTITVACDGRFPFTFHANGSITWEGRSQVIGEYTRTGITIDLQRGAPGYAAQNVVSGAMSGVPTLAGDMSLLIDVTADGKIAGSATPAYLYTIKGSAEPAGASVTLFGSSTGVASGPVVSTSASPDTIQVILRHAAQAKRAEQADTIKIEVVADWGNGCNMSQITTLFEAMVAVGTAP